MREVLQARLERWGFAVSTAESVAQAGEQIATLDPDVVISDLVLPDGTGLDLLRAHTRDARLFIIITSYGTIGTAVQAMKGGAAEYLTKPLDYKALQSLLEAHDRHLTESEPVSSREVLDVGSVVGQCGSMQVVRRQIAAVAPTGTTVMIVGESGTGKEFAARAIHRASTRGAGPFVAVNAAALSPTLGDGELLGHPEDPAAKGEAGGPGLFEQAHLGTLFLDAITEMPLLAQAKLLRVLEDGRVRLGSMQEVACDVRVITATNQDPAQAMEEGRLRADLYHRLCVFRIDVPPLRERRADIPLLARHLLIDLAERHHCAPPDLNAGALAKLHAHHYPGNVRELRNLLERAMVSAQGRPIGPEDLEIHAEGVPSSEVTDGITIPAGVTAADAERILILETLKRTGNNKAEAARRLGLDVKTIRNKIKAFEVNNPRS